jgi:hypothetical protein
MFKDASDCRIAATEYTSKHRRFSLTLQPPGGGTEFCVAFTDVAAYRFDDSCFGVIVTVHPAPAGAIIASDWQQILVAGQSGLWPGRLPPDPPSVTAMASRLGLRGFTIALASGARAWAISKDFVLLGRRARA